LADEPTGELDSHTAAAILGVLRSLNATYGITIIIVTHDAPIVSGVDRVVGIRDGRTSTESLRRPTFRRPEAEGEEAREDFTVLDSAGRLQIPREYLDKLKMKDRVKVQLEEDHVSIWPEHS
jgi:ABC-type glutathione transport system ATPase component